MISNSLIQIIRNPDAAEIGDSLAEFLAWLGQPSAIFIDGSNKGKTRAVSTLLHGNEPSGTQAIFHYLKSGEVPKFDTLFIVASVGAATTPPAFSHRMLPGTRDLNRCFRAPYDDEPGKLAKAILDLLHETKPECLIDIHNTSGSGPAFAVAITGDPDHLALTSLFTNDLIVTDLRLGALMELSESDVPTVTIECGGANDHSANIIAKEGLHRYLSAETVRAQGTTDYMVNIYHNPIRLETIGDAEVAYEGQANDLAVITLPAQAEKFNYGTLTVDDRIGILAPDGLARLSAKDFKGKECLREFFEERKGGLYPRNPLKVFMVTTNPFIAKTDCILYFIACNSA